MTASASEKNTKQSSVEKGDKEALSDAMDPKTQLREIQQLLFGQQMATVQQSIAELDKQNQKQFSDMGAQIKSSISSLNDDLNTKLDELSQHVEKLYKEGQNRDSLIEDDANSLKNALDSFEKQTEATHTALENQLFTEADKLSKDMIEKHETLQSQLSDLFSDLSDRKTDRKTLASLLVNMANSLDGETN